MTKTPVSIVLAASAFAAHKHRDQRRKGADASPYINHPIAVANVLANEGGITDDTVLAAALLHDTIEDTDTTVKELQAQFGPNVAASLPYTTGAMIDAARSALQGGIACALVSGFQHAGYDSAAGFCTFNGLVVIARRLLQERAKAATDLIMATLAQAGTLCSHYDRRRSKRER